MTKVEWPLRKYSAIPPLHYLLDCCYDMLTYSFHANRHYGVQYLNCAVHSLITTSQRLCLVSTIPLPFFRSVATVAVAGENGNAGNPFSYRWMKWPERWLVVDQRQNGKKRIRSYCYGTAVTAQRQVETVPTCRCAVTAVNGISAVDFFT